MLSYSHNPQCEPRPACPTTQPDQIINCSPQNVSILQWVNSKGTDQTVQQFKLTHTGSNGMRQNIYVACLQDSYMVHFQKESDNRYLQNSKNSITVQNY